MFLVNGEKKELPEYLKVSRMKSDIVFQKMCKNIYEIKCKIDLDEHVKNWDKAKRKSNPYELVHVNGTCAFKDDEINEKDINYYNPLSRAFFKMLEIYEKGIISGENGVVVNLAEGPGGFLEALFKKRNDNFYALTLYPINRNIPGWTQIYRRKNHFLQNNRVKLLTGDMYKVETIINLFKKIKDKAILVTADGGFDYSKDFNNQERNSWRIIFSEIVTCFLVQKEGGSFVCKIFDAFTYFTLQMIYIVHCCYDKVYIFKPKTSRPANSEKYIIAKGFRGIKKEFLMSMLSFLKNWENIIKDGDNWHKVTISNLKLPNDFIECFREINDTLVEQQKKSVLNTLKYISEKDEIYISNIKREQEKLSEEWFSKYNVMTKNEVKSKIKN